MSEREWEAEYSRLCDKHEAERALSDRLAEALEWALPLAVACVDIPRMSQQAGCMEISYDEVRAAKASVVGAQAALAAHAARRTP